VLEFVEDFSELGEYMNVPISSYSSGMGARLESMPCEIMMMSALARRFDHTSSQRLAKRASPTAVTSSTRIFVARIHGEDPRKVLEFVEDFSELGEYMNVPISSYSPGGADDAAAGRHVGAGHQPHSGGLARPVDPEDSVADARLALGFSGGFHPLMTGKENVIFVARIHGEDPRKVLER
jgi:ABC-type polysaccharide/polyol phosphate transport system ATPase subunit